MRISVVCSTERIQAAIMRTLEQHDRGLVVMVPWTQQAAETLREIGPQLTAAELDEVCAAFGLT